MSQCAEMQLREVEIQSRPTPPQSSKCQNMSQYRDQCDITSLRYKVDDRALLPISDNVIRYLFTRLIYIYYILTQTRNVRFIRFCIF